MQIPLKTVPVQRGTVYPRTEYPSDDVDRAALEADLRKEVRGEVRFDAGSRALYATDGSVYRQVPIGVVLPKDADDVVATIAVCRRHDAPILPRGCGTGLKGQTCNTAVVIDMTKYMNKILEIDPQAKRARVEPGVICDDLSNAVKPYHLTYGPAPATHNHAVFGGMIGNNSCGVHSITTGKAQDNVDELEILTYDGLRLRVGATSDEELARIVSKGGRLGEIYAGLKTLRDTYADEIRRRYPDIPRNVAGYNLPQLLPEHGFHVARALVGSEATCVTILEAKVHVVDSPPVRGLVVLGYSDAYTAADHVPQVMTYKPIGLEGFDRNLVRDERIKGGFDAAIALLPPGDGWLLAEFGGQTKEEVASKAHPLIAALKKQPNGPAIAFFDDLEQQGKIWKAREGGVGASSAIPGEHFTWPSWEDSAVPPEKLGDYLRDLRKLMNSYGYIGAFFGHFGQGCLHTRISFDLRTAEGVAKYRSFINDASDLVLRYGGSLSGEHGEGQVYSEVMPKMYGPRLMQAFHDFKYLWDPRGKMNPGKVVDAYRVDQNLRLGPTYDPPPAITHFKFPDDQHSFNHATVRCIGIGKCRQHEGGTMCPSYMVTREEKHSTRGRAHLLFEMLQGDPINGWKDENVKEALDLCLACKGCKGECPVKVDIATYKSEFLAHYYSGRLRPPSAYAMGMIDLWARLAMHAPGLVNFTTHAPLLSDLAKRAAGLAPQRQLPAFAPYTFKEWFRKRPIHNVGHPQVILWPDTFNNYFHPHTAQAAVAVLEAAGFQVIVPQQTLCCGRPLYDYGMLDRAKRQLLQILDTLRPEIQAGIPVVGLEPSCAAVFRDELTNLLPDDQDARRLRQQTFLLSEFLVKKAPHYQLPALRRKAVVHGHCHHKAIMGMDDEETILHKMGLDLTILDAGCCGMAGSFGYERGDRYDVSIAAGERVLLPAVRDAAKDTLIIANGFSCRGQIEQQTDRHALHLAQVIQIAMTEGSTGAAGHYPEQNYITPPATVSGRELTAAGALLAGTALAWGLAGRVRHA